MKEKNAHYFRCPECGVSDWEIESNKANDREVREGFLHCQNCGATCTISNGIVDLLKNIPESVSAEIKSSEGTNDFIYSKQPEFYNDSFLLNLPKVAPNHPRYNSCARKSDLFFQALSIFPKNGEGKTLVDIAAGNGWSTRYFAQKDYCSFAVDIVRGKYRGLSGADVYFAHKNIFFERVLGLMEILPFADNSIDYVFSINSLHHSKDLSAVFAEVSRILAPDGIGIIVDDVTGYLWLCQKQKAAKYQREENKHMDHVYSWHDYTKAIRDADLGFNPVIPQRVRRRLMNLPDPVMIYVYYLVARFWYAPFIFRIRKS